MVTWVNGAIGPMPRCACGCARMLPLARIGRLGRPRRYLGPRHRYRAQQAERRDPTWDVGRAAVPVREDISAARIDAVMAQAQAWLRWQRRQAGA